MGCNCKKVAENAAKYTDDEVFDNGLLKKFIMMVGKIIIVVLIFLLLIVLCPVIIIYCMICLVIGKQIKFKIFKTKKA